MRRLTRLDTQQVFEQLEALGWVVRAGPACLVNPKVHKQFADRAKRESEQRAAARRLILGKVRRAADR